MKRTALFALMTTLLLAGCGGAARETEAVESWRDAVRGAERVTFSAVITARTETESLRYEADGSIENGETAVTVTAPENIAGVVFRASPEGGALEYDGAALYLGPDTAAAAPCAALPLLREAAEEGRLLRVRREGDCLAAELETSETVTVTVWLSPETLTPTGAEIAENGYTAITVEIKNWHTEEKTE